MKAKIYKLELNDKQKHVVERALLFYYSITEMADLLDIMYVFNWHDYNKKSITPWRIRYNDARKLIREAEFILFGSYNPLYTYDEIEQMTKPNYSSISLDKCKFLILVLDLYSRIGIGQFEEILHVDNVRKNIPNNERNKIESLLKGVKFLLTGCPTNGSLGIYNPDVSQNAKIAHDIIQVVRYRISWDQNPKGGITVNFDEPLKCSELELPKIMRL